MLKIQLICKKCGNVFEVGSHRKNQKYCSYTCSNNRIRTQDELNKISTASKQKFIDNPELRKKQADTGKRVFDEMNKNGKAFRMPKGYHTDEYKTHMKEIMTNRIVSDETREKIKKNHWSNQNNREEIINKIKEGQANSISWNSYDRRNILAEWSLNNPDKVGPKLYKKGYYISKKTKNKEYYASGFELEWMKNFDNDTSILHWTKNHKIKIKYTYNNKTHNYIPDFMVSYDSGEVCLIETKGRVYNQEIINIKNKVASEYATANNLQYKIIYQ